MKQFEYKRIGDEYKGGPVRTMDLNELGEEGWELVSIIIENVHPIFYFKREKQ